MQTRYSLKLLLNTCEAVQGGITSRLVRQHTPVLVGNFCSRKLSTEVAPTDDEYSLEWLNKPRQKLVILGTGWGSYSVLKHINKSKYDVVVVSPRNHFLFTPLLCSTTVGTLEFRSIIEPVRSNYFRNVQDFHLSHAVQLDPKSKKLTCQSAVQPDNLYDLKYDKLVIGVGAVSNTFGIPGVKEHAFFLKELSDARGIRDRIISNFELANQPGSDEATQDQLLHIVIVGGGPTGVEFGAELYDFLREDVARLYSTGLQQKVKVTLIEANKILGSFDKRLREYAEKKIIKRKQFEILQGVVAKVTRNNVHLKDGTKIPCGLVVWSTGLSPRPFVQQLTFRKDKYGHIMTNRKLQVPDVDDEHSVFSLGDCADIEGMPLPATAQVAERKGKWLAEYLNGDTSEDFQFSNLGMLAYVGGYSGLSDFKPKLFKLTGFHAWFVWRSAYLTKLGSWKSRFQVPMDWLKTLIFGRDISRF
uniref:probable NADH dehydrogenase n=1 Tax=Ciona intestinalis TaxID=7719 RepID=UPI000180C4C9|nr:probable NADH dehydrogenase [Ciona intestinalis]|eukprot:XP_002122465.1 probable NADH dehydrogenase [Ciona intestinalis]